MVRAAGKQQALHECNKEHMNKGPGNLEEREPDSLRKASEQETTVELRLDTHVGRRHRRLFTSPRAHRFVPRQGV